MPSIKLERLPSSLRSDRLTTDGLNAIEAIPGASNARVTEESDDYVAIDYDWDNDAPSFDTIEMHLGQYGLRRIY
jgi:hypothetical protein